MSLTRAVLCITVAAALLGAAPAGAATLAPTADLQVNADHPTRNFGTAKRLVVARHPAQRAFVRFALDAPPRPGARILLRLYPLRASQSGLLVRHASDRPWDERTITFRTAPRTGPQVVRSGPLKRHRWARIDVTKLVNATGVVALSLVAGGAQRVEVASREAGAGLAPRLTVSGGRAPLLAPALLPSIFPPPRPAPAPEPAPRPAPVDPSHPCGVAATAPQWEHVVWIVMENKASSQIMGSANAPFINSLATTCAWTSNFFARAHPSLPNYLAMTSGDTHGVTDNAAPSAHPLNVPSIFSQLGPGGWRALQESMASNCETASAGMYVVRHNPAAYYTNVAADCLAQNVPLSDPPDLSAPFTFITPNLCNGMHDCSVAIGDTWLSQWVPKILDSPQYRSGTTALFITWDEDDGSAAQQISTLVIAPSVPSGLVDATRYDHYSMLRTTQEMLGLPPLGQALTASSMRPGLNL